MSSMVRALSLPISMILLAGSSAGAQQLGGADETGVSLIRILAALVVCLAAAAALIFIVKGRGGHRPAAFNFRSLLNPGGRIEVIEVRRISSYAEISVIACDGTEYVIVSGSAGQQIIDRRDRASASSSMDTKL